MAVIHLSVYGMICLAVFLNAIRVNGVFLEVFLLPVAVAFLQHAAYDQCGSITTRIGFLNSLSITVTNREVRIDPPHPESLVLVHNRHSMQTPLLNSTVDRPDLIHPSTSLLYSWCRQATKP